MCPTLAVPARRDDEYLWFDTTHRAWLAGCERVWPVAAAALGQALDEGCGGPAERRFFALHPASDEAAVPSRFGYHAGLRAVRDAARSRTVAELLTLDIPTAGGLVREYLDRGLRKAQGLPLQRSPQLQNARATTSSRTSGPTSPSSTA